MLDCHSKIFLGSISSVHLARKTIDTVLNGNLNSAVHTIYDKQGSKNIGLKFVIMSNYQFSSVAQSCPTLCDPTDCSMPGFPVHHQLPEFTQTHVHQVGDAIQLPHPLLFPSLPIFNLSQHQGLF